MKKQTSIIIAVVAALLIGVYVGGAFYYKDKFQNRVVINNIDVSGMTLEDAESALLETGASFDEITITSDEETYAVMTAEEINHKYVDSPELPQLFDNTMKWGWPKHLLSKTTHTTPLVSDFDADHVKTVINDIDALDYTVANAKVVYDDETKQFVIQPGQYEIALTDEDVFTRVNEAITENNDVVNLQDDIVYPDIQKNNDELIAARDEANGLLNVELTYDFGDREEVIDQSLLGQFIVIDGTTVTLDRDELLAYVTSLAKKYDTFGTNRTFETTTGETITTNGGSYGWMMHRGNTVDDLANHIRAGESKTITPVYSYKALIRDEDDVGNSYVEIDLDNQKLYVYIDGELQAETQTVTGNLATNEGTPTGVFPINYKERDAVLRGEGYAAPVDYWVPFNNNIGIHDADWNPTFGGDYYKTNGSNGCINLPPKDTKEIFDLVYPGMPVIVH